MPEARPSVTGRPGRCPGVARAAAHAHGRRPARPPGHRHTRGHGPDPGSRAARRPRHGSGPGPACPSTSTGRPRSAHGRPVPSWRAVGPRHTARRAARRLRHCGVHRSPLHSQPDRGAVPVERADGSSGQFPRDHCSTRVGGSLRRAAAARDLRRCAPRQEPSVSRGDAAAPPDTRAARRRRASGSREFTAPPVPYPGSGRPAGPPDADPPGQDDAGVVGDRGEEDDSCP